MVKLNKFIGLFLIIWASMTFAAHPVPQPLSVEEFINQMVADHNFKRNDLVSLFEQTEYIPEVINRINAPLEKKPWDYYKNFFLTPERINGGVKYWRQHKETLAKAAQQYGVSPEVIVAIIGIETKYGEETGKFPELGTLATLSFRYPKRGMFFQNELKNYLLLTREYQLPPSLLKGSYAGALGIPQFMPSAYRKYAVSYDGNSDVNLLTNHEDAIASIAYYLRKSGWQANQPVAVPAKIDGKMDRWLVSNDARPIYQLKKLEKLGVRSSLPISANPKSALIAMHNSDGDEYWLTFQNFYAIMAYNPRTTYAMAIFQLSEAIKKNYANIEP